MIDRCEKLPHNYHEKCSEETLLFQMISGLHASINMHVAYNFFDYKTNRKSQNPKMFFKLFNGEEEKVKNLFFLYSGALRAINVAKKVLQNNNKTEINNLDQMNVIL